jgi:hypothetical protein
MQNSSSPSPILDFGRQHATVERSIQLAVLRLLPNDQFSCAQGENITGSKATAGGTHPSSSRGPPLLEAGKLSRPVLAQRDETHSAHVGAESRSRNLVLA